MSNNLFLSYHENSSHYSQLRYFLKLLYVYGSFKLIQLVLFSISMFQFSDLFRLLTLPIWCKHGRMWFNAMRLCPSSSSRIDDQDVHQFQLPFTLPSHMALNCHSIQYSLCLCTRLTFIHTFTSFEWKTACLPLWYRCIRATQNNFLFQVN